MRRAFSLGYSYIVALSPSERYILNLFRHTANSPLLCFVIVEAAQAGCGDFLADARVSRLEGKCDDKDVYWLIQFVTVPDT